jgi:cytochrome c biogenesis protein CcmG/thiol:disulfide interchange protein DsbE
VPIYGLNYKDTRPAGWAGCRLGNPYVASLFDVDGKLGIDFGVYGVPETFVIDRQGVIRYKHIGPVTPEVLRDKIEPLLKSLQNSMPSCCAWLALCAAAAEPCLGSPPRR